jgi:HEAT repeat protein
MPAVLDALLTARARLGAPAVREELARWLDSADPGLRAAAIRALARLDDPQALAEVGRVASTDADLKVREAAVEALGASGRADALPIVSRTFDSPEREIRQASARAVLAIGGQAADDALVDLALRGGSVETRTYATLLLITSRGRQAESVRRIAASNPSPEVRALLEHGLQFQHQHGEQ